MISRRLLCCLFAAGVLWHAPPAVAQDRAFRVIAPWDIRGLEPARSGFVFQRIGVAETLVTVDTEGRFVPALASAWQPGPDGRSWRFTLRAGARFHDGTPVTAEAVATSLDRARAGQASPLAPVPFESIRAEDSSTLLVTTTEPFALLPAFLAHAASVVLAPAAVDTEGRVISMIATGPYKVARIDGATLVEAEAVLPTDAGGPPIQRVVYRAVEDGETRARIAEAGEAEMVLNLLPAVAERLRRNPQIDVKIEPLPRNRYLKLNAGHPALSDIRVRRAISFTIDRAGIARAILRNRDTAATQLLPPLLAEWHQKDLAPLTYDPARARALLDEVGWRPGPGGIRVKDGRRLTLEILTHPSRPELPVMAQAIQASLRDIGMETTIRTGHSDQIIQGHQDNTVQIALTSRSFVLLPDPLGTIAQDFGARAGAWGRMNWRSPELEGLIERYQRTFDASGLAPLRRRIVEILQDELPVIPVSWFDQVTAVSEAVTGYTPDPFEASYHIQRMRWAK